MDRRNFLGKLAAASATGLITTAVPNVIAKTTASVDIGATRHHASRFPNIKVTTHEGDTVAFYDDLIKNKLVLLNFFYTTCTDICPGATHNLSRLQKLLGDRVGKDIFMYSLSLNPAHDTVESIRAYAKLFGAGDGWKFITGTPADMELLRQRLGFVDPDPELDKDRSNHIGILRFGVEPLDRWGAMPIMSNPVVLVRAIERLTPRRRSKPTAMA